MSIKFRESRSIIYPNKDGEEIGKWILFGRPGQAELWAGSYLILYPSDEPYRFGRTSEDELVYVQSGEMHVLGGSYYEGDVVPIPPVLDLRLKTGSEPLRTYTLWKCNFYGLWQDLRLRETLDPQMALLIAKGITEQLVFADRVHEIQVEDAVAEAKEAFTRLMKEFWGDMTHFERQVLSKSK